MIATVRSQQKLTGPANRGFCAVFAAWQQQPPAPVAAPNKTAPKGAVSAGALRSGRVGVQPLGRRVVVVLQPVFVAHDLAVELVHQLVDGGVHVFIGLLDKNVAALDV